MNVSTKYDAAFKMLERIGEIETPTKSDIIMIHEFFKEKDYGY